MFNRRGMLALGLMAIVSMSLPSMVNARGQQNKAGKVEGTLVGVASNGVVIQKQGGTKVSVGVVASTKVELNGKQVLVTKLPLGAHAQALFNPDTMIATKVEARN